MHPYPPESIQQGRLSYIRHTDDQDLEISHHFVVRRFSHVCTAVKEMIGGELCCSGEEESGKKRTN